MSRQISDANKGQQSGKTDANKGQQGAQGKGTAKGGAQGQGAGSSADQGGGTGDEEADDADDNADDDNRPAGDKTGDKGESSDKTLERRNRKLEKENLRLKRKLQGQGTGGQQAGQQQQQQGQQQQADNSQTEAVTRLESELRLRDARDSFLDEVLDEDNNPFQIKSRSHAQRAWKMVKDDAKIDEDGEITNLPALLKSLKKDMPEWFAKGKSGKKGSDVEASGDGGSGSQGRQPATGDMNANIRQMYHNKRG